jgi:hypothetical protein
MSRVNSSLTGADIVSNTPNTKSALKPSVLFNDNKSTAKIKEKVDLLDVQKVEESLSDIQKEISKGRKHLLSNRRSKHSTEAHRRKIQKLQEEENVSFEYSIF